MLHQPSGDTLSVDMLLEDIQELLWDWREDCVKYLVLTAVLKGKGQRYPPERRAHLSLVIVHLVITSMFLLPWLLLYRGAMHCTMVLVCA
jgi:hypothetical protein